MAVNVPEGVDALEMKRELAYKGYHVVKASFEHNPVTNERIGRGVIQIRAANPRYQEELKKEIEKIGFKMARSARTTPSRFSTWK